jgi:ATP-dependent DNA helicase RecQ
MSLAAPSRDLDTFGIDWATIDRRRDAELQKLDAVQMYAYTKRCRRAFVLKYFGDPAAGTTCSGCDNCQGTTVARPARGERVKGARPGRKSADSSRKSNRPANSRADATQSDLAPEAQAIFDRLRALRREIAQEEHVPPYIVFDDKTLRQIAVHRPRTLAAFGELRGIGPVKTERFGPRFIAVAAAVASEDQA